MWRRSVPVRTDCGLSVEAKTSSGDVGRIRTFSLSAVRPSPHRTCCTKLPRSRFADQGSRASWVRDVCDVCEAAVSWAPHGQAVRALLN